MTTKLQQQKPAQQAQAEQTDEHRLISLLKAHPDILCKHPSLLTHLHIPHAINGAASLIERQVQMLRDRLQANEQRMQDLMAIARDNERLANSRHRLAVNLLGARDLDDVISTVLHELGSELKAEFAVIRLIGPRGETVLQDRRYLDEASLQAFSTMMRHHNPMCGRSSDEQNRILFGDDAERIASAAVIPLVAGADLGLLGLGSSDAGRFHASMGTEFLAHIGELISAALAVHLESSG